MLLSQRQLTLLMTFFCYFLMTLSVAHNDCVIMTTVELIWYESCTSAFGRSSSLLKRLFSTLHYAFPLYSISYLSD